MISAHAAVVGVKGVRTTASLDMAISRAQRSLRAFKLRRILLELLQNSDNPMTIAAIWEAVRERGGGVNSVDPLAEITAVPTSLRNSAYPFERVGKDKWKWGGLHAAAAWRWTP